MNKINEILILIGIAVILFRLSYLIYLKKENKLNIKINPIDFKNLVISILIAAGVGFIILKSNPSKIIEALNTYYKYNQYIFIGIFVLLILEIYFYKNSIQKILNKYYEVLTYIICFSILTLIAINKANAMNITNSILWDVIFYTYKIYKENIENDDSEVDERNDEAITKREQLYPQRLTELEHIERYISDNAKSSSCTISICADWGEGKTSFINVIRNDLNDKKDYVLYIQPMIMDSRESLIQYFFSQLKAIMKQKSIYTGKGSSINKYLKSLMEIIGKDSKNIFENLFGGNEPETKDYRELKDNLQKDIDKLLNINSNEEGNIIVLIDDFDRVEENVMYQVLVFIKEVASFRGCVVIFLMDYKNIKSNKITYEYLDKFVSKKFELKKINRPEIIKYYIDKKIYFDERNTTEAIIKDQYINFKKNLLYYMEQVEKCIITNKEEIKLSNENLSNDLNVKLKNVEQYIDKYKDLSSNPRKLKKLFKEIEDICKFIHAKYSNNEYKDIKINYDLLDCNEIIFKIAIVKIFYTLEFDELVNSCGIEEYIQNKKSENIIKILFKKNDNCYNKELENIKQSKKYEFINGNFIKPSRYSKIITEIKTLRESMLDKLDNDTIYEESNIYGVIDMLNAIYDINYKKDRLTIEKRLDKLSKYIIFIVNNRNIRFNILIDKILEHSCTISYNIDNESMEYMLNIIILKLINENKLYIDINEKHTNISSIIKFKSHIISKYKGIISLFLMCGVIDNNKHKYYSITENIKEKSIKDLNDYAIDFLKLKTKGENISENELLEYWIETNIQMVNSKITNREYKNRIEYTTKDMLCFLKIIKLLDSIENKINQTEVKSLYKTNKILIVNTVEELQNEIKLLKKHIDSLDENENISKEHKIFCNLVEYVYIFIIEEKTYIDKKCLQTLKDIYTKLNDQYNGNYEMTLEWSRCAFNMDQITKVMKVNTVKEP